MIRILKPYIKLVVGCAIVGEVMIVLSIKLDLSLDITLMVI